jgi:hypothetical protein
MAAHLEDQAYHFSIPDGTNGSARPTMAPAVAVAVMSHRVTVSTSSKIGSAARGRNTSVRPSTRRSKAIDSQLPAFVKMTMSHHPVRR